MHFVFKNYFQLELFIVFIHDYIKNEVYSFEDDVSEVEDDEDALTRIRIW